MKKIVSIFISIFVLLVIPYLYVEALTLIHYNETKDMYQYSTMLSSDNYHKVISYSQDEIKILSCEPSCVFLCNFTKTANGEWTCEEYKPVFKGGSLTEAEFYPIYPTKHLIEPQESKENFECYEILFREFAESEKFQYSVVLDDNKIDRDISLVADNVKIIISLYNNYDGLSGYETVEITYSSFEDLEPNLFTEIQKKCMHKTVNERECVEFVESKKDLNMPTKFITEKYPNYLEAKSKDLFGNGEFIISYVKTSEENIMHIKGLTKRDGT